MVVSSQLAPLAYTRTVYVRVYGRYAVTESASSEGGEADNIGHSRLSTSTTAAGNHQGRDLRRGHRDRRYRGVSGAEYAPARRGRRRRRHDFVWLFRQQRRAGVRIGDLCPGFHSARAGPEPELAGSAEKRVSKIAHLASGASGPHRTARFSG